jgi:nucleoside phosphorylase
MTTYKILLVENEREWIDILDRKIRIALTNIHSEDSIIKHVSSFQDALDLLGSEDWHLLVTDIGLGTPQEATMMKGKRLVVKAKDRNIPVIVVSGTVGTIRSAVRNLYEIQKIDSFFDKVDFHDMEDKFIEKVQVILSQQIKPIAKPVKDSIQIGIITIRDDEYNAILRRLNNPQILDLKSRYRFATLENGVNVAVTRCNEPGNLESQAITRNMLDDLNPKWIFVVGIAGGLPDSDFSLGDVIVSSYIYDLTTEAANEEGRTYDIRGGWLHDSANKVIQDLPGSIDRELSQWHESINNRPLIDLSTVRNLINGSEDWKNKVESSLRHNFTNNRHPHATTGKIAASDTLLKDYSIPNQWQQVARKIKAIEMESAGVYRAAHHLPILAIRGISDIVGLRRDEAWTKYACETAAAFALSLANSPLLPIQH